MKPTREMTIWYHSRTNNHIKLVKKWYEKVTEYKKDISRIDIDIHDSSKFNSPEYEPYIFITWNYYCTRNGIDFDFTDEMKEKGNEATIHHITTSRHHPEYWDVAFTVSMFNTENRDAVADKIVDATEMPYKHILEMMADWFAVSEERETNPYDWAEMNINKRWKFSRDQVGLIYSILDNVWEKSLTEKE